MKYIVSPEGQARLATSSCYWGMPANGKAGDAMTIEQREALRWNEQPEFLERAQLYPIPDAALDTAMQDMWTEMLNHDAFQWFVENGGMTRENGQRFRDMVLSQGNSKDYAEMYRAFAGRDPGVEPMLKARGLKSSFRATGQTGILIGGRGIAVDAVIADFASFDENFPHLITRFLENFKTDLVPVMRALIWLFGLTTPWRPCSMACNLKPSTSPRKGHWVGPPESIV